MRIKNLNLQTTLWSAQLTIECDMKEAAELQRIIEEAGKVDSEAEYTVSIKRRKKKRSLDANAYMWVLLRELAFKVENSPIELYKHYVRGFGQYYVIPVREDALEAFSKVWSSHGILIMCIRVLNHLKRPTRRPPKSSSKERGSTTLTSEGRITEKSRRGHTAEPLKSLKRTSTWTRRKAM